MRLLLRLIKGGITLCTYRVKGLGGLGQSVQVHSDERKVPTHRLTLILTVVFVCPHPQVHGRMRVLLVPPHYALEGLAPFPAAHPYAGYSAPGLAASARPPFPPKAPKGVCVLILTYRSQ